MFTTSASYEFSMGLNYATASVANYLGDKLQSLTEKITTYLFPPEKKAEIFHLGGINTPFVFVENNKQMDLNKYFYERIPVKINNTTRLYYGNTLKEYVDQWMGEKRANLTQDDFQTWMGNKLTADDIPEALKIKEVRYFTDKDRQQTEVTFENGALKQVGLDSNHNEPQKLKKGEYIFVIGKIWDSESKEMVTKLFATPKKITAKGKTQHSSFLRGGNVQSAGKFTVNDKGEITDLNNSSGHYKPASRETAVALKHLRQQGCDLSKIHVIYFKTNLIKAIYNRLGISIPGGVVNMSADRWLITNGN